MQHEGGKQPLLTIAVPTYQRAEYLRGLLEVLRPQAAEFAGEVEVLVSDNASPDATPEVVAAEAQRFAADGAQFRAVRHPENVGADANFVSCFRAARGRFFWLCSDDDVIVPGALRTIVPMLRESAELDLVYATSYGFRGEFREDAREADPMGRTVHTYRANHRHSAARTFAYVVNTMFSFVSGMIVNRERLLQTMREEPEALVGTNLVQLGWTLPLLMDLREAKTVWTRPIAARLGNAHGYSVGRVFGENLAGNVRRLLPGRTDLQSAILNPALRRWFPSVLIDVRSSGNTSLQLEEAHAALVRAFGRNPRYWLFTWPALAWPLPAAKAWTKLTAAASKGIAMVRVPGFWRKRS